MLGAVDEFAATMNLSDRINVAIAVFTAVGALASLATAIIIGVTLRIYRRQAVAAEGQRDTAEGLLRLTRDQLELMREQFRLVQSDVAALQEAREGQQLYEAMSNLLNIRKEIERVLTLREKPLDEWSAYDVEAAHVVSSRFHLVGMLMLKKSVPEELFSHAWFYSVPNCHEILQPFLQRIREERDPRYWGGFDLLQRFVAKHTTTFPGFGGFDS